MSDALRGLNAGFAARGAGVPFSKNPAPGTPFGVAWETGWLRKDRMRPQQYWFVVPEPPVVFDDEGGVLPY
jgi:hypothetical protein